MDLRKINLGELELFLEAVKVGSIRELARSKEMDVSQVSRTIKRMEKRIGQSLFERSSRGLLPSPFGLRLKSSVEKGLKELGLFEMKNIEHNSPLPKIDGVGGASFLMDPLILPLLGKLKSENIISAGTVVELPPDRLILSGLRGLISLAFHAGELQWPTSWVSEKIGTLDWGLFGSRQFFNKEHLTESEALNFPFVYPIYWSPEGLRETEDKCPIMLRHRKRSIGVSSGWMALKVLDSFPSLAFVPTCLVTDEKSRSLIHIQIKEWSTVCLPVYATVHSDLMTKKLFDVVVDQAKSIF